MEERGMVNSDRMFVNLIIDRGIILRLTIRPYKIDETSDGFGHQPYGINDL